MARARRVNLHRFYARLFGYRMRVHVRIDVRLYYTYVIIAFKSVYKVCNERGFAAPRRGHNVEKKDFFLLQVRLYLFCLFVVAREDILFNFNRFKLVHSLNYTPAFLRCQAAKSGVVQPKVAPPRFLVDDNVYQKNTKTD